MPFNYTGAAGYNIAPPSHGFGNATLRLLGIDPGSSQGQMLRTNNQAGPEGSTPWSTGAPSVIGGAGGPNGGAGPLPPHPNMPRVDVATTPYPMGGNPQQTDPAFDPNQGLQNTFGSNGSVLSGSGGLGGGTSGGLTGLAGITPEQMKAIFQHMQNMARGSPGGAMGPSGPMAGDTLVMGGGVEGPARYGYANPYASAPVPTGYENVPPMGPMNYDNANRGGDYQPYQGVSPTGSNGGGLNGLSQRMGNNSISGMSPFRTSGNRFRGF